MKPDGVKQSAWARGNRPNSIDHASIDTKCTAERDIEDLKPLCQKLHRGALPSRRTFAADRLWPVLF
jgi:hypothetical protein